MADSSARGLLELGDAVAPKRVSAPAAEREPVPEFSKSAESVGGGQVVGRAGSMLVLGEKLSAQTPANSEPVSVVEPAPAPVPAPPVVSTPLPTTVASPVDALSEVLVEDAPVAATSALAGAFASAENAAPTELPPHIDVEAKPTHTFGASALRDAVALLAGEEMPTPLEAAPSSPPAAKLPIPWRAVSAVAAAVLVVVAVFALLSGSGSPASPALDPTPRLVEEPPELPVQDSDGVDAAEPVLVVEEEDVEETVSVAAAPPREAVNSPAVLEERRALRRAVWRALKARRHRQGVDLGLAYENDHALDWELHIGLAHAARLAGQGDLARRWFRSFADEYPENKFQNDAVFWIAQLTWQIDGIDKAIVELEAVADDSESPWRNGAERELRRLLRKQTR